MPSKHSRFPSETSPAGESEMAEWNASRKFDPVLEHGANASTLNGYRREIGYYFQHLGIKQKIDTHANWGSRAVLGAYIADRGFEHVDDSRKLVCGLRYFGCPLVTSHVVDTLLRRMKYGAPPKQCRANLTAEQMDRLLTQLQRDQKDPKKTPRLYLAAKTMYLFALRKDEAQHLRWKDFRFHPFQDEFQRYGLLRLNLNKGHPGRPQDKTITSADQYNFLINELAPVASKGSSKTLLFPKTLANFYYIQKALGMFKPRSAAAHAPTIHTLRHAGVAKLTREYSLDMMALLIRATAQSAGMIRYYGSSEKDRVEAFEAQRTKARRARTPRASSTHHLPSSLSKVARRSVRPTAKRRTYHSHREHKSHHHRHQKHK